MNTLDRYQRAFAARLFAEGSVEVADASRPGGAGASAAPCEARGAIDAGLPDIARLAATPGFAIYRNTVIKGCVDALEGNFPSVSRIVGREWMRAAATVHARADLPREPSLLHYGEGFPGFLASFPPAADMPYLAPVAALDRLWIEAHAAADAPALALDDLAALAHDAPGTSLRPHPAARWSWCANAPAWTIWSRNRFPPPATDAVADAVADDAPIDWRPEGALLTRPGAVVLQRPIDAAAVAFLDACAEGASLIDASLRALESDPGVDLPALLESLVDAGAFLRIDPARACG